MKTFRWAAVGEDRTISDEDFQQEKAMTEDAQVAADQRELPKLKHPETGRLARTTLAGRCAWQGEDC